MRRAHLDWKTARRLLFVRSRCRVIRPRLRRFRFWVAGGLPLDRALAFWWWEVLSGHAADRCSCLIPSLYWEGGRV